MAPKIYRLSSSGTWQEIKKLYRLGSNGAWAQIKNMYRLSTSGIWQLIYQSALTPTVESQSEIAVSSANATTGLRYLLGTHYHWNNATNVYYNFERSIDGSTYTKFGPDQSAVNPASGSGEVNTQNLLDGSLLSDSYFHVQPNTTNYYRYFSKAENTTYSTNATSTSSTVSVEGARDISSLTASSISYTSLTLQWNSGLYNGSWIIYYGTSSNNLNNNIHVSSTTKQVTGLSPNTTYYFAVKPYTGSLVNGSVTGYRGNLSSTISATTTGYPAPIQNTAPTISGSGIWFTQLSATSGTYSFAQSVTTRIRIIPNYQSPITSGQTSDGYDGYQDPKSNPYNINQADASYSYFASSAYAQDVVVGLNGETYFYYSSAKLITKDVAQDTYDRTAVASNSNGNALGIAAPAKNTNMDPSSWYYNGIYNKGIWSTNGSKALSSSSVNFNTIATDIPRQTLEWGKDATTIKASLPSGAGGNGLMFWETSLGSWWAVVPDYKYSTVQNTVTTYSYNTVQQVLSCSGSVSGACSLPALGSTAGSRCSGATTTTNGCQACNGATSNYPDGTLSTACGGKCSCTGPFTSTTYGCTSTQTGTSCPSSSTSTYNASTVGQRCGACTANFPAPGLYTWPTVGSTSTTYYTCTLRTCSDSYSYSVYQNVNSCTGAGATNTTTPCANGNGSVGSVCNCTSTENTTTSTQYDSLLKIYAATGSSIVSKASEIVATTNVAGSADNANFTQIKAINVYTSGNTINAQAYQNANFSTQLGNTLSYTATSGLPSSDLTITPKFHPYHGSNSAGLMIGPAAARLVGYDWDNFYIG